MTTTIYSYINGVGKSEAGLDGADSVIVDTNSSKDIILISVQIDGSKFRTAQAEFILEESSAGADMAELRNVLVQQLIED